MNLNDIRTIIDNKKGQLSHINKQIDKAKKQIDIDEDNLIYAQEAQLILQIVARETQESLEYRLNELVSLAQLAIFQDDAYNLAIEFEIKRGKTEAKPMFEKDGKKRRPMFGTGFGAIDTAALVLRPTLWALEVDNKKKRNTFIYDEPIRHLNDPTQKLHRRAADMIKNISKQLNIQIIIVTQNNTLTESADKVFKICQKNGKSFLKEK